jgi:hypothetical protein
MAKNFELIPLPQSRITRRALCASHLKKLSYNFASTNGLGEIGVSDNFALWLSLVERLVRDTFLMLGASRYAGEAQAFTCA